MSKKEAINALMSIFEKIVLSEKQFSSVDLIKIARSIKTQLIRLSASRMELEKVSEFINQYESIIKNEKINRKKLLYQQNQFINSILEIESLQSIEEEIDETPEGDVLCTEIDSDGYPNHHYFLHRLNDIN